MDQTFQDTQSHQDKKLEQAELEPSITIAEKDNEQQKSFYISYSYKLVVDNNGWQAKFHRETLLLRKQVIQTMCSFQHFVN